MLVGSPPFCSGFAEDLRRYQKAGYKLELGTNSLLPAAELLLHSGRKSGPSDLKIQNGLKLFGTVLEVATQL